MTFTEKLLRWIVIIGIFALPAVAFLVIDTLFFPYITGKNFAFRIIVEIISGSWLALAVIFPRYRPRRDWILAAFTLFVLIMALADAFGAYPFKSFWSNYERMDGWITLIHTLLLVVVAACMLNTENLWRRLWQWSLVISGFVSVLGLLQVLGIVNFGSGGSGLSARVDATFGNPIYLAIYMLFNVFIALLLWTQEGKERWNISDRLIAPLGSLMGLIFVVKQLASSTDPNTPRYIVMAIVFYVLFIVAVELLTFVTRRWLFTFIIALDTSALLFSGTRGAMLGLIGGALLALILYAFSADGSKRIRQYTVAALVIAIVAGAGLRLARNTPVVQEVGFLNRLSSLSLSDDTTMARLLNIQIAWQGIKERPVLGWGQENYALVFDKYYDPRMYGQEQWFDRVHNIIFDWWVTGGTLGLLSYLSIFAAALWALWKRGVFAPAERAILTGLLAGYFVHNLTVFDNITSYILFAMVLGYIVYRVSAATNARPIVQQEFIPQGALPVVAILAVLLVGGSAWYANAAPLAENRALIQAISPQSSINTNLADFQKAISYGTYGTQEAREQLAQIAMQIIGSTNVSNSVKAQFAQLAVSELQNQAVLSPLDARFPLFAGSVLDAAGDYADAKTALARAHDLSPQKQSILFTQAQNAQLSGDTAGAVQFLKSAYLLDTDDLDARLYYAAALITTGDETDAQQVLDPVIASGQAADTRISSAYAARGEYAKLIPIWQAHIKAQPADMQGYFTLAAIYYAAHDKADAIAALTQAELVSPAIKSQADQYIQQIQNGTLSVGAK